MSETNAAVAAKPKPVAAAKAEKPEGPISALLSNQWKARESGVYFSTHEVVPNAGTPLEHLTKQAFWANVAAKMRPGDTVIAFPRDGAWYAELVVWARGPNWAQLSIKFSEQRPQFTAGVGVASDLEVAEDPLEGIVVRRASSGVKVKGPFPNHADASNWIKDNQRALRN